MLAREVKVLFRKELRQLLRSRAAMASALVIPTLVLLLPPVGELMGTGQAVNLKHLPPDFTRLPGLRELYYDSRASFRVLMPLFVTLSGMVVPSVTAVHTLVAEREARTLELLVALPVRVSQVLLAKVLALLSLAVPLTFGLLSLNVVVLVGRGLCSPEVALALYLLLGCTVAFSTSGSLLISLLARDYRAASNLSGLLILPSVFLGLGAVLFCPGPVVACLVLSALLAVAAGVCLHVALRFVTFEWLLR